MKKKIVILFTILILIIFSFNQIYNHNFFSKNTYEKLKNKIKIYPYILKNKKCIQEISKTVNFTDNSDYTFFIAGHAYGYPWDNNQGLYEKFYNNLLKKNSNFNFGIFAGDITREGDSESFDVFDSQIKNLGYKIYIAPGNHDIGNDSSSLKRINFKKRYNHLYQSFNYNNDLFILLDGYEHGWSIKGKQLTFLIEEIKKNYQLVNNIFIITSPVIFLSEEFNLRVNSYEGMRKKLNFWDEIFPLTQKFKNNYYIISGDVGAIKGYQLFCKKIQNTTFIATGMGSGIYDNYLIFKKINKKLLILPIFF